MRIRTYNAISAVGLDRLPNGYEVGPDVENPDGVLVRSADLHSVVLPDSVLAVARAGAGTNNIPVADLSARGVVVFNTPGANANAVKELVIGGILLAARNLVPAAAFAAGLEGTDAEINEATEKGKKAFVGFELPGRTLGVIGLGAIGVQVANAARALGMHVLGFDPQITIRHAWQLASDVQRAASLEDVFAGADIVTVHVPLVDATRGMVDAERLSLMKPGSVLLNFSRAGIVDERAVLAATENGTLASYVCDFPSAALRGRDKVVALPHLGASTGEAEDNCAVMAAEQLTRYLEDGEIRNSVNFPEATLRRGPGTTRLAIANSNVPNMVGQISTLLADAGLNIADLLNKSRGDLAYTLIDVDGDLSDDVMAKIRAISGVLAARRL
ncbi:MAG TPA: phosphoglycerate dehydrogenase [Propionibacteriaceae bacterium]|nr:phosphoglycerate dehydrogenase [Propionibacteriaceae bacterium]